MSKFLKSLVGWATWWNGASVGAKFHIGRRANLVGTDEMGNKYYEARDNKDSYDSRKRRYVIFNGYAEASKVSPDWHGWLHHTFAEPPTTAPFVVKAWEKDHLPNMSGTVHAYKPQGALGRGGERQKATGDYEAWTPN
ncbi:NADH:ubiquinone oxidoreductase subunit NDUFA12 [Phenylobacterium immobile]|uniref:NADH:ubiquinone oxidoreductase subunit NDUFA12 n=1 Tax=Phenylobacterium immobile TaxID=21 RepID=UPI000AEDFD26|nr:NADH:ubiquinone oxidoreductase subunit NDUFA12 [Phenylobacterium immobile]